MLAWLINLVAYVTQWAFYSLAIQTLYLTMGGRKGSGDHLYNVSCPSPGIVGKRTSTVLLMLAVVC